MENLTLTEHKATTEFLCIAPIKNEFVLQIKAFYEDLRSRDRAVSIKTLRVKFGQLMPSCQLSQSADYHIYHFFVPVRWLVGYWERITKVTISSTWRPIGY